MAVSNSKSSMVQYQVQDNTHAYSRLYSKIARKSNYCYRYLLRMLSLTQILSMRVLEQTLTSNMHDVLQKNRTIHTQLIAMKHNNKTIG